MEQNAKAQRRLENRLIEEIRKSTTEREESQQKDQQLKLDEIASNLLNDCDGVTLVKTTKSETSSGSSTMKIHGQYDLGNWKYAELRDAINNSMDINLLVACEEEIRRRVKIYNEWKSRNYVKSDGSAPISVPLSVLSSSGSGDPGVQRCFKYAFDTGKEEGKQGMFYAHFSGEHIQRQLTLRPSQMPQLMMTDILDNPMLLTVKNAIDVACGIILNEELCQALFLPDAFSAIIRGLKDSLGGFYDLIAVQGFGCVPYPELFGACPGH
ncbi:CBN-SPE-15 protein [Caenorhabditis brenneri]|uniref:CBN-SPE-15 protein n=1 Tax=Caenorhabditis brenneri TaxID=135651 RepID=G0NYD1_CAEBE|nr:CBN-SPE-15 protein [Caenorhabditis brenneri]